MLHLDAGVHLDEHVLSGAFTDGVEQEFDGAGVDVADRPGELDGVSVQLHPNFITQIRRRGDFNHFLVPTLHRAVALEQVHGLAGGVRQNLHLDVSGAQHCRFQEHRRVAEGTGGLTHGLLERPAQLALLRHPAHAASTAASDGLGEDGEADLIRLADQQFDIGRRLCRFEHGYTRSDGVFLRGDLVTGHFEYVSARADEGDAGSGGSIG